MALEKLDEVSAAYVNNGISLHLKSKDGYDQKVIAETLKAFKLTIKEAKAVEGSPFAKDPVKKPT